MLTDLSNVITYVCFGVAAFIMALEQGLKTAPHLAARSPKWVTSGEWNFTPLTFLVLGAGFWALTWALARIPALLPPTVRPLVTPHAQPTESAELREWEHAAAAPPPTELPPGQILTFLAKVAREPITGCRVKILAPKEHMLLAQELADTLALTHCKVVENEKDGTLIFPLPPDADVPRDITFRMKPDDKLGHWLAILLRLGEPPWSQKAVRIGTEEFPDSDKRNYIQVEIKRGPLGGA
jgi:hypothetical protein